VRLLTDTVQGWFGVCVLVNFNSIFKQYLLTLVIETEVVSMTLLSLAVGVKNVVSVLAKLLKVIVAFSFVGK
jgi:hypothetical protein